MQLGACGMFSASFIGLPGSGSICLLKLSLKKKITAMESVGLSLLLRVAGLLCPGSG